MALFTPNIDKLREKNDIQGLLKLTKHRKAEVRLNALLALVKTRDQSVTQELKKLINDPDPRVRTIATIKFGDINDPAIIENLRSIIISGSQRDKIEALRVLSEIGPTDDLEI